MFSIVGAIMGIGLLIIVHEAGHYFVAKWCGMRVDRFSIGFGPAIIKWRRNGTDFVIAPIPFGGYVQIAGMNIAEEVEADDKAAFPNRPVWQRFLAIFAGPATNYLFAIVLAFVLYAVAGEPTGTVWYKVAKAKKEYDAHGKLFAGDRIVKVNNELIYINHPGYTQDNPPPGLTALVKREMDEPGSSVDIVVLRDGAEVTVPVTPKRHEMSPFFAHYEELCGTSCYEYYLGIDLDVQGDVERRDTGILNAAGLAAIYPVEQSQNIVRGLYMWANGEVEGKLTGPVGITRAIKRQFAFGWIRVLEVLMLLNVYLGLFNLLPLPALDGGRLVFLSYEMATRRRANPKIEATVHMVGIMALIVVLIFVTYGDIVDAITG